MAYLQLCGALMILLVGAEALVRGAASVAASLGISRLVVGLTVVAFGTSAPEMVVSVGAAMTGESSIALGNVVGSNIANILFILGLSASLAPIAVSFRVIRWDVPLMIVVSCGFGALGLDGRVSRLDGAILFALILLYTWWNVREGRNGERPTEPIQQDHRLRSAVFVLVGLSALWLGGRWFVSGALALAKTWGLSELVVGLTVVALGTSLPEAATSVVASVRGERDLAVGNIVGSNVFNLLGVMGLAALAAPNGVGVPPTALNFDIPVMIAATLICLPIFFTGSVISRWEGLLFLGYYGAYVLFAVLSVRSPSLAGEFGRLMIYVVLPLTLVTLAIHGVVAGRKRPAQN